MGGDVEAIKERLDIAEVLSPYLKLEKAGANFKARCPFHSEKTPSFFISTSRQSYYCFGCGAKGDIFTFIEETEGVDFREALKLLADKAGIELRGQGREAREERTEKDRLIDVLDEAASFYQKELQNTPEAIDYLKSRGISGESIERWRIGYARDEWRFLYSHLIALGFPKELIVKAGLAKEAPGKEGKEPYDVFRGRVVFPLSDRTGKIVAFSGRALGQGVEPKYLNSPDTTLFTKGELLYGFPKAKDDIRKKDYAILVEGQMDLVLSHQAGVANTVASSGTAFTISHLERLRKLSSRIILAFDGDSAGEKAAERSAILGMSLGMEVKIASMPKGQDPADVIKNDPAKWKDALRQAVPAIEHFLNLITEAEKDQRKAGKLIEKKILPMILILQSSIERSHFVSMVSKKTGLREEVIWQDLRIAKVPEVQAGIAGGGASSPAGPQPASVPKRSRREMIEERLSELASWRQEFAEQSDELEIIDKEKKELEGYLSQESLKDDLARLTALLSQAESSKDEESISKLSLEIAAVHGRIRALEEESKMM
jgi:DNA primase